MGFSAVVKVHRRWLRLGNISKQYCQLATTRLRPGPPESTIYIAAEYSLRATNWHVTSIAARVIRTPMDFDIGMSQILQGATLTKVTNSAIRAGHDFCKGTSSNTVKIRII